LKVATLISFSGFDHHEGTRPQRIGNSSRLPSRSIAEGHDRMPVILEADQFEPWLSGRAGGELLKPTANDVLQRCAVSRRVNSSRASDDDATLVDCSVKP
jgi:putative SOS response-associated peptidase YedK